MHDAAIGRLATAFELVCLPRRSVASQSDLSSRSGPNCTMIAPLSSLSHRPTLSWNLRRLSVATATPTMTMSSAMQFPALRAVYSSAAPQY
jgi:hypothetical protein